MERFTRQKPMRKPVSKNTVNNDRAKRVAIERWEGEGGRPLPQEEGRHNRSAEHRPKSRTAGKRAARSSS